MRLNFVLGGLRVHWRLRRLKRLARSTDTPSRDELNEMLVLLDTTDSKAYAWPSRWSQGWYRQLAMSDTFNAHNLCCTTSLADYNDGFIHEMCLHALRANNIPLLEALAKKLSPTTMPSEMWKLLQDADPIVQWRLLTILPGLDELEGAQRAPVLAMLASSEPHFWMYDHAGWYTHLARKWCICPPASWWELLHTLNLYRPPNNMRSLVQHYCGSTISQMFEITGRRKYSLATLESHRSDILSQDPWAVVRSAFYGDTTPWPPRRAHLEQNHADYVDALAILTHYYPEKMTAAFDAKVPDAVRQATPRVEMAMFLGMENAALAYQAFSSWLATNNGSLASSEPCEEFSLGGLV